MNVAEFLEKFIDGYLFCDLKQMEKCIPDEGDNNAGGAGYPMLMTSLAGMELLGYLLRPNTRKFKYKHGKRYFNYYWKNYLTKVNNEYEGLSILFRNLLRNGMMHTFIPKYGVEITKENLDITISVNEGIIRVDCVRFYHDFYDSYINKAKSDLMENGNETMLKVNQLAILYKKETNNTFQELSDSIKERIMLKIDRPFRDIRQIGMSLSIFPSEKTITTSVSGTGTIYESH